MATRQTNSPPHQHFTVSAALRLPGRAVTAVLSLFIRGYQLVLSPLLAPRCRFHPSCSAYALGALKEHGALKGSALTTARIARCNPWNDGGLDPVPAKGSWHPDITRDGRPRGAGIAIPDPVRPLDVTSNSETPR